jgi:hypothetical protein
MARNLNRIIASVLILLGIYLLIHAGYQEIRGDTVRPWEYMPFSRDWVLDHHHSSYPFKIHVLKANNPERFREFMNTHWFWAALIEAVGWYALIPRQGLR